jgi:flagellar protein FlbD
MAALSAALAISRIVSNRTIELMGIMIWLTRLNHAPVVLNSDLIEHIETTPDTVVTLTTGQILRVRESAEEIVGRVIAFRRRIYGLEIAPAGVRDSEASENSGTSA